MSDKTIDEVTPDTNVTGVEKLPVSDGGTPKSMTVEQVKDFVLTKINALPAASDIAVASDGVFIKKSGAMKPLSAQTLASAIVSYAFGRESAASLAGTDTVVIAKSGVAKTTTLATLAQYVKDAMGLGLVDFGDYVSEDNPNDTTQFLIADSAETATKKTGMTQVANALVSVISDYIPSSTTALDGSNDYIVAVYDDGTDRTLKRVKLSASGIGAGNVTGPATNTDNKIPQWDGANSKTLKDGLTLVSSVSSTSSGTEVPTAAATYSAVAAKVTAPETNSANKIPAWNGTANSKTLVDGYSVVTEVGSSPTDAQLPTAKAVKDKIDSAVSSTADVWYNRTSSAQNPVDAAGYVPQWRFNPNDEETYQGKKFLCEGRKIVGTPTGTATDGSEIVSVDYHSFYKGHVSSVYQRTDANPNQVPVPPSTAGLVATLRDTRVEVGDKTYLLVSGLKHYTGETSSRAVWFQIELTSVYEEVQ